MKKKDGVMERTKEGERRRRGGRRDDPVGRRNPPALPTKRRGLSGGRRLGVISGGARHHKLHLGLISRLMSWQSIVNSGKVLARKGGLLLAVGA